MKVIIIMVVIIIMTMEQPGVGGGDFPHPTSYTMGIGSFPGVKRPGCSVDHPPHLLPRLKKE